MGVSLTLLGKKKGSFMFYGPFSFLLQVRFPRAQGSAQRLLSVFSQCFIWAIASSTGSSEFPVHQAPPSFPVSLCSVRALQQGGIHGGVSGSALNMKMLVWQLLAGVN